jgi:hypothetical protein
MSVALTNFDTIHKRKFGPCRDCGTPLASCQMKFHNRCHYENHECPEPGCTYVISYNLKCHFQTSHEHIHNQLVGSRVPWWTRIAEHYAQQAAGSTKSPKQKKGTKQKKGAKQKKGEKYKASVNVWKDWQRQYARGERENFAINTACNPLPLEERFTTIAGSLNLISTLKQSDRRTWRMKNSNSSLNSTIG